jgi:iron complex transport system substrate-binding protein
VLTARPGLPVPPSMPPRLARVRPLGPAAALLLALVLAACSASPASTSGSPGPSAEAAVASAASASAAASSAAASFPLTLIDDEGTSVSIPTLPARIVSLAPSVTETLFALGEGSKVVGVTSSDDYPPAVSRIPQVATYTGVELEKLVAARPDLVIAWKGITSTTDITKMRTLAIPVVVLYAQTVPAVLRDIALVGEATGEAAAGAALDATLVSEMTAVTAAARATGSDPRTFYELDATKTIYTPAPDDFTTDMIRRAGGNPITSGIPGVYSISLERLVAADPQVIVLGDASYGTTPAIVAARPGWEGMTAVKTHAVRPVDDTIVTRPGPRIIQGLEALAEAIHPGLALPSFPPVSMGAP